MTELDDICHIDHIRAATKYVLQLLARREYSVAEVWRKLRQKHYADDVIERVVADLQAQGALSESRFAEAYCRFRQAKGFGPVRIQNELQQRGVKQSIVDQALHDCEIPWDETIQHVRSKRFGSGMPADPADKAKQIRFLQYRGFTHEQIHRLFDEW